MSLSTARVSLTFVKLPLDRREKLIPTIDEIQNNFYIIN